MAGHFVPPDDPPRDEPPYPPDAPEITGNPILARMAGRALVDPDYFDDVFRDPEAAARQIDPEAELGIELCNAIKAINKNRALAHLTKLRRQLPKVHRTGLDATSW